MDVAHRRTADEDRPENGPLYDAFRQGSRAALAEVYATHAQAVYRYALGRLRSAADARDVTQEVFMVAFGEDTRSRFRGLSPIRGFLLGIAHNVLRHHSRADRVRDSKYEAASAATEEPRAAIVDDAIRDREVAAIVDRFVAGLSARDGAFFKSHLMERTARRVTGQAFGLSEEQVRHLERKLRRKALRFLRRTGYLDTADLAETSQRTARQFPLAPRCDASAL